MTIHGVKKLLDIHFFLLLTLSAVCCFLYSIDATSIEEQTINFRAKWGRRCCFTRVLPLSTAHKCPNMVPLKKKDPKWTLVYKWNMSYWYDHGQVFKGEEESERNRGLPQVTEAGNHVCLANMCQDSLFFQAKLTILHIGIALTS